MPFHLRCLVCCRPNWFTMMQHIMWLLLPLTKPTCPPLLNPIFTIYATPPLRGVVLDAPPGGSDVDYQSSLTLHGWWEGFFDRETGVNVYQYQYSRECLNASHFTYPLHPGSDVMETNADYATAQADGRLCKA